MQEEERRKRETERILAEMEAREQEEARQLALQRGRTVAAGEKLDKNALLKEDMEERMLKHKRLLERLQKLERSMDHLERARREVEAPKIEAHYAERSKLDQAFFEQERKRFLEAHRAAWEQDLEQKRRLERVGPASAEFRRRVMEAREAEFNELRAEREERVREQMERKREEVLYARKRAYAMRLRQEEEERRRAEEEERRRAEAERGARAGPADDGWHKVGDRGPGAPAAAAPPADRPGKFVPSALRGGSRPTPTQAPAGGRRAVMAWLAFPPLPLPLLFIARRSQRSA